MSNASTVSLKKPITPVPDDAPKMDYVHPEYKKRSKMLPEPRPLYGLDRLAARPEAPVLVCEGEKAADAGSKMFAEYVVVTSSGGAGSAHKSSWAPLVGRRVVIWPDADAPGQEYARDVARLVRQAGSLSVAMVKVPDSFTEGWDLADDPPEGWEAARYRDLLNGAEPMTESRVPAVRPDQSNAQRPSSVADLVFETPAPWPDPVDGAQLLDELASTFRRYLALQDGYAETLSLFTMHTHAIDASFISPILNLSSAEKQSGKTRTLELLAGLVLRPLFTSNITAPALFRSVDMYRPTLLIDEADSFVKMDEALRGILNSGHAKAGAFVIRTAGDNFVPCRFSTWCPKVVAGIGRLPGTVEDRSIILRLRRRAPGEQIEQVRRDRLPAILQPLLRKAARWATDSFQALRDADPMVPEIMSDRAQDNWRPLIAIAEAAGGDWPRRAREAALALSRNGQEAETSSKIQLLADLRELFDDTGRDTLKSATIVEALCKMEDRPWPEFSNSKPITARQLASLLKPFDVTPGTQRDGDKTFKGYKRESFEDVFLRYLPPADGGVLPVTASQPNTGAGNSTVSIRNTDETVTGAEGGGKPRPDSVVTDVTDPMGGTAEKNGIVLSDPGPPKNLSPCRACGSRTFWMVGGPWICAECHPPADPSSADAWFKLPEPVSPAA